MKHFQVIDNRTFFFVDDDNRIFRARLTNRWNKEEIVFDKPKKEEESDKPNRGEDKKQWQNSKS